jgi:hypothetical protein
VHRGTTPKCSTSSPGTYRSSVCRYYFEVSSGFTHLSPCFPPPSSHRGRHAHLTRNFNHVSMLPVQLTFTNSPFFMSLDQFAMGLTPDSCRSGLQAACCRWRPFCHIVAPPISPRLSHSWACLVCFPGLGVIGMDLAESTCDEITDRAVEF